MTGQVAVLLALHRSDRFLGDLLQSLDAQSRRGWSLVASHDRKDDVAAAKIAQFSEGRYQSVIQLAGPNAGFAANFLHLISQTPPEGNFAAFCDQDDVWLPDKLERAVAALATMPAEIPALYASRSIVCDRRLRPIALSPLPAAPSFATALSRSIASGNTMLLNRAAIDLLQAAIRDGGMPAFHDWWAYQMVTGAGGHILFDPAPTVLYRQHRHNQLGSSLTASGKVRRLAAVITGRHARWTQAQLAALARSAHRLSPENRKALVAVRSRPLAFPLAHRLRPVRRLVTET